MGAGEGMGLDHAHRSTVTGHRHAGPISKGSFTTETLAEGERPDPRMM